MPQLEQLTGSAEQARAVVRLKSSKEKLDDLEAVIVALDEHTQALSIVEALGCSENKPPVIVLTNAKMAPAAYHTEQPSV
jgi:hypothetical protein